MNSNSRTSRRRRKRRSYALLILAGGLLLFGIAASTLYLYLQPTILRIAVGPPNSDDQKLVQTLAQIFARERSSIRITPITTAGSVESIALLAAGKTDLAVARGDLGLPANAESVIILRKNVVVLWAPAGLPAKGTKRQPVPKVKSITELAGRRIGVVGRTEANVKLLRVILSESGVNVDNIAVTQFATNQIAEMARDTTLDAYMTVGPLESKITRDAISATAASRGEPKFLPIEVSEAIAKKHQLYESEEIPASIFSSSPARPDEKVDTVSVNHLIIAPRTLSDTKVGAFARQVFNVRQQLARELPNAPKIEKPDTDKDAALPAHEGAAAYFDGNERTFLEKYTDYIWGIILVLSGLGSVGAWLRHYWKGDEREQYETHRDNLLELISRVREADSLDHLTAMQSQADEMLREALYCYEDGTIEEGDLSAMGLALRQFHDAAADRRTALGSGAPDMLRMRAM
ncbi:MAG: TAXI family TRAP transporter solute-binding subunit [Bradyrhizobium sp.]|uniref:TAXI family TRAP transporter solute-binding subunit n=1 Tax=Bradyrhizobium sp. TaxID=376 RepID=UPI003D0E3F81